MISKTNLHHLHLIQCQVNDNCLRSICRLHLQSLSFIYTKEWKSYLLEKSYFLYYMDDDEEDEYKDYEDKILHWMNQTTLEKIFIENVMFDDFVPFAEKIVSTSGESIKEVYIYNCKLVGNLRKGVELFAVHCPQITVLRLTLGQNSFDPPIENKGILKTVANFKNLKELVISPAYLCNCDYDRSTPALVDPEDEIIDFWKVTQGCERLNEIRIIHYDIEFPAPTVYANCISDIVHSKNLTVLELVNFNIEGNTRNLLSNIAKNCTKLEHLSIDSIAIDDDDDRHFLQVNGSLRYFKNLRILCIESGERFLTRSFMNNLCCCEKLEKIKFCLHWCFNVQRDRKNVKNLIITLPKFKNLYVFRLKLDKPDEELTLLFEKFSNWAKKKIPAFSGSIQYIDF